MFFGTANNLTDINKKVSELWEEEKKYRIWIIGFSVALLTLFALNLSMVIVVYLFKNQLLTHFTNLPDVDQNIANGLFNEVAMTSIILTISFFLCAGVFIYSIFNCYKIKSFEKLDSFSSFFLGFQTFLSLAGLFRLIISDTKVYFGDDIMICYFILPLLSIPVWLLLSSQIKRIKRTFLLAKRQEEINAYYASNGNQMGQNPMGPYPPNSPFGFPFQQKTPNPIPQPQAREESNNVKDNEVLDSKFSKLQLMTVSQLRKIADRLSISGNKEMKKAELIKIILAVSNSLEKTKKTSEETKKEAKPKKVRKDILEDK